MKSERLIGPEHLPGGDAKQERVTNVPSGAGHSDFNGSFHGAISHKHLAEQSKRFLRAKSSIRELTERCARFPTSLGMTGSRSAVDF